MAIFRVNKYKVADFFDFKRLSPQALIQDNLISFNYKSPNGVHDPNPLVFVIEKQLDRFYGLNVHYDSKEYNEIIGNTNSKVIKYFQDAWFRKYPEKKKQLYQSKRRRMFGLDLVEPKDFKAFTRSIDKKTLEQFLLVKRNDYTFRCYLYVRMTNVKKAVWRLSQPIVTK